MPIALDGAKGITFPTWTTATRPASPAAGQTGFNTTTTQLETYDGTNWEIHPSPTTQGTSGQYLQSAGAGVAPTWATLSSSGALIRAPQILTSGTSYTTPSNCTAIYVEAVGGGGSGGTGTTANIAGAGGGGSGAYCAKYFTVTGSTAYTYAIGAGGAGNASTGNGNAGGNTTFTVGATTITAGGGSAGSGSGTANNGFQSGGAGGTATNGDMNSSGSSGTFGVGLTATTPSTNTNFGTGGPSVFGRTYGGGSNGANNTGVAGGGGMIRIWEYT